MRVRLHGASLDPRRRRPLSGRPIGRSLSPPRPRALARACYPVYRSPRRGGPLPAGGLPIDIEADVFRHEPSKSLDRLQSFRMREFVRIGSPRK